MGSVSGQVEQLPGGDLHPLATTFAYYGAFIGLGLISASLGPTLVPLAAQTQTAISQISILFVTRSLGYLLGSMLAGRIYDRTKGHPVMAVALLVMGLGMAAAPLVGMLWSLAFVLLIVGLAEGTLDVGGNALLMWVHRSKVGPYMNALHLFFAVGAFLSPIVIAQAISLTDGIRAGYWVLALFTVPIAIWLYSLQSPRHIASHQGGKGETLAVNWRLVALLMVFLGVYVGAEVGMAGWLSTYAIEMGLADSVTAAYLTSVYWGAFMIGRIFSIPIATRFRPRAILWTDLIGCLVSISLPVFLPQSQWAIWVGAFGFGLFVASIFPTLITWAERRMNMSGLVTSMFFIGSSIGGIFFPWFIGQLFGRYGAWITMPAILAVVVLLCGLFVVLMANGGTPQTEAEESA